MTVTDQQVETALITWFKNEVSWDKGMAPWSADQFRAEMRATLEAALSASPAGVVKRIEPTYTQAEYDEAYELGKRDGYSEAVQQIDQLTGGDGEYRYCSDHDPERHTPGPAEMIQRIVDRFETLNLIDDASKTGRDQEWGMSAIEPAGVGVETPPPSTHVAVWQGMETAPKDGKHSIFAIKFGPFVYSIQGTWDAYKQKWINAADREGEYLAWMPNVMLPDAFCPWTDEYKSRAALATTEGKP